MAIERINVKRDKWQKIEVGVSQLIQITHNTGRGAIVFTESKAEPKGKIDTIPVCGQTITHDSIYFVDIEQGYDIWCYSFKEDSDVTVTKGA